MHPDQIASQIDQQFSHRSFLSGDPQKSQEPTQKAANINQGGRGGEGDFLQQRLALVSAEGAQATVELLTLIHGHQIEPWVAGDERRAGVYCSPLVRKQQYERYLAACRIFFGPHHLEICEVLDVNLKSAWQQHCPPDKIERVSEWKAAWEN